MEGAVAPRSWDAVGARAFPTNGRLRGTGGLEWSSSPRGEARCDRGGSTPHTDPTGFAGAAVACPDAGHREPLWAGGGHGGVLDDQGKSARAALAERGGRGAASCIGVRLGEMAIHLWMAMNRRMQADFKQGEPVPTYQE